MRCRSVAPCKVRADASAVHSVRREGRPSLLRWRTRCRSRIDSPYAILTRLVARRLFAPDVLAEPLVVVFQHRLLLLRLVDRMSEALVQYQLHRHVAILQGLIQLERVRRRHPLVLIAVLDQRWGLSAAHITDRRRLAVDLRIVPRRALQVLACERMYVGVDIVSHPVGDTRADTYCLEPVAVTCDECRDVSALAPPHRPDAVLVHHAA